MDSGRKQGVAAIYARISKADRGHPERNQSIDNQVRLAEDYIKNDPGLCHMEIEVFRDEGYTGMNMDRPSVRRLMAGIYLGRIQALVIKDFSRLSRNHLQLSELREETFFRYAVIFISVGDWYDSRRREEAGLYAGFRSIFYEYYCRDVSRKVKYALEAKKQNGEYAAARAPYGYRKGEDGGLEICPGEADVVKEIYGQAVSGKSTVQIANWLNLHREGRWQAAGIWRILNNPVYMGTHVWHKYESEYRNGFYQRCVGREEWRMCRDSHPAIIPQEEFERVWEMQKRTAGYGRKKGKRHIFHGITRCGYCQKALCRHRKNRELLVCREKHQGLELSISWRVLWKICAKLWFGGELPQMREWEMELFVHCFAGKITVMPGNRIYIQWKVLFI